MLKENNVPVGKTYLYIGGWLAYVHHIQWGICVFDLIQPSQNYMLLSQSPDHSATKCLNRSSHINLETIRVLWHTGYKTLAMQRSVGLLLSYLANNSYCELMNVQLPLDQFSLRRFGPAHAIHQF